MTANGRLSGKFALITGGSGGIGLATCIKFIQEGVAGLSVIDLSDELLQATEIILNPLAQATGAKVVYIKASVASEEDTKRYVDLTMQAFNGRLDISVQNAGLSARMEHWHETSLDTYQRQMDVNTQGPWLGVKYSAPAMLATPAVHSPNYTSKAPATKAIVILSSVAALYGQFQASSYTASKWASRGLSLVAANEYGPLGIRCNSVHPGPVNTPMLTALFDTPESLKAVTDPIPLRRIAEPEEIANVVCFLSSDEASYVNGTVMAVHGGQMPS